VHINEILLPVPLPLPLPYLCNRPLHREFLIQLTGMRNTFRGLQAQSASATSSSKQNYDGHMFYLYTCDFQQPSLPFFVIERGGLIGSRIFIIFTWRLQSC